MMIFNPKTCMMSSYIFLQERKPDLALEIMAFRARLLSSTISDTLDVWELKDLGHQTAQRIVQASDSLQSVQEINKKFPIVVSSLSRMKLPRSTVQKLLSTVNPLESDTFRVDFRSTHVHNLNNLEEDAMYRRWRNNIKDILMQWIPNRLYHFSSILRKTMRLKQLSIFEQCFSYAICRYSNCPVLGACFTGLYYWKSWR